MNFEALEPKVNFFLGGGNGKDKEALLAFLEMKNTISLDCTKKEIKKDVFVKKYDQSFSTKLNFLASSKLSKFNPNSQSNIKNACASESLLECLETINLEEVSNNKKNSSNSKKEVLNSRSPNIHRKSLKNNQLRRPNPFTLPLEVNYDSIGSVLKEYLAKIKVDLKTLATTDAKFDAEHDQLLNEVIQSELEVKRLKARAAAIQNNKNKLERELSANKILINENKVILDTKEAERSTSLKPVGRSMSRCMTAKVISKFEESYIEGDIAKEWSVWPKELSRVLNILLRSSSLLANSLSMYLPQGSLSRQIVSRFFKESPRRHKSLLNKLASSAGDGKISASWFTNSLNELIQAAIVEFEHQG